jgi:alpha-1,3-rhamnosyltransferase
VSVMLEALLELDRPFTLLIQENTGNPGQNANRALRAANGEYCCLMSLDDLLLPGCISRKILLMSSDEALKMVGNETYLTIDTAKPVAGTEANNAVKRGRGFSASKMMELEYTEIGTFLLQGTVFRTEFIRSIGGFDEDIAGDDLNLRTKIWSILQSHAEMRFKFLPEPGFVYRLHGSNINLNTLRQVRTVLDWRDRYFPDRPLPVVAEDWLLFYIRRCYSTGETTELKMLLDGYAEARRIHDLYAGKWTNKLGILLSRIMRTKTNLTRLWA